MNKKTTVFAIVALLLLLSIFYFLGIRDGYSEGLKSGYSLGTSDQYQVDSCNVIILHQKINGVDVGKTTKSTCNKFSNLSWNKSDDHWEATLDNNTVVKKWNFTEKDTWTLPEGIIIHGGDGEREHPPKN